MTRIVSIIAQLLGRVAESLRMAAIWVAMSLTAVTQAAVAIATAALPPASWIASTASGALRAILVSPRYACTVSVLSAAGFVVLSALTNPYMKEELSFAHERSSAIEVIDSQGRWLGIVPPANFSDWSDGTVLPADHEALPIADVPSAWRACIVHLEDREFDGVSRWLGIDPLAILKSGWQTLTGDRRRGASTLYMQIVRTLRGQMPDRHEAPGELLVRKVAELLGANALVKVLSERDSQAAERFVAMHLPLVIGASGSGFGEPAHGIGLASRLLFGVPAEQLSVAQQAILAAAVKSPILMALPSDTSGRERAAARWQRVRERADFCLREAPGLNREAAAKARTALAAMSLPVPRIDADLQPLLPKDATAAWRIMVSPARRALYFARNELGVLKHELDQNVGSDWRGRVLSVRLSTSAPESRAFVDRVTAELEMLEKTLPGLELSLTGKGSAARQAQIVVACADDDGKLRRIYSSHEGLFWTRKAPVGSVAKMVAAVALGRVDTPTTGYCRTTIPGLASLQDEGKPCSVPSAWIAARDAFARSNNQAINWALRKRVPRSTLTDVAAALRLPPFDDVPASTALTLGTFELTPAEMLRMAHAIGGGIAGLSGDYPQPSVVTSIMLIDADGRVSEQRLPVPDSIPGEDVVRIFTPQVRSYVSTVLSATSKDGGTLHRLRAIRDQFGGNLFAKTGTVSVLGETQALHILGTFTDANKPRTFLVTISAPRARSPIGHRILAARLSKLPAIAVCPSSTVPSPNI